MGFFKAHPCEIQAKFGLAYAVDAYAVSMVYELMRPFCCGSTCGHSRILPAKFCFPWKKQFHTLHLLAELRDVDASMIYGYLPERIEMKLVMCRRAAHELIVLLRRKYVVMRSEFAQKLKCKQDSNFKQVITREELGFLKD
jgi:hypothetical protein